MDEFRARRVVDSLRDRGVNAHLLRGGVGQFGVRVSLPGGREAEWDTDGTAGLEAQVMRDGMLVGYVPQIEGSEDFGEAQIIDAIGGVDVVNNALKALYEMTGEQRYKPSPLFEKMIKENRLGRKTGRGFYDYTK